jgi:membrane dipeptidase
VYIPGEKADSVYRSNGQVSSTPGYARVQLEQIDIAHRVIEKYGDLDWALRADEFARVIKKHHVASLLGLEGGHAIENSLDLLRMYYALGARYMTLTHNVTLDWADAALDTAKHGGLTPFGREVVREMNRLGMLVDLAHVSPGVMSNALDVSVAPVIFSHSGARALVDYPRNVPDSILARLPRNDGVVMVPFVPSFVSKKVLDYENTRPRPAGPKPRATIGDVADVIEHIKQVAGVDHVGLGSDFDGISETVQGLEDVSCYPALFAELAKRGWSDEDLKKLAGGNILRVLREAEGFATLLRRERPASTATIGQLDARP